MMFNVGDKVIVVNKSGDERALEHNSEKGEVKGRINIPHELPRAGIQLESGECPDFLEQDLELLS
jgi:hypothetical protein